MSALTQSVAWFREELDLIGKFAGGVFQAISESRQAKADAFVRPYLAKLSESDLAEMGYSKAQIETILADRRKVLPFFV